VRWLGLRLIVCGGCGCAELCAVAAAVGTLGLPWQGATSSGLRRFSHGKRSCVALRLHGTRCTRQREGLQSRLTGAAQELSPRNVPSAVDGGTGSALRAALQPCCVGSIGIEWSHSPRYTHYECMCLCLTF